MRYGSVCSGIEAASVAWHALGWKPAFYSEIEPFPCAVLDHRWPSVPNLGDMTKFKGWKHEPIDLLVGGTPCQSFSVAGLRKGLADPRGNLALTFLAILDRTRPRWVVWENVPGVLSSWTDEAGSFVLDDSGSSDEGCQTNDFDTFTAGLRELGYGFAYRMLDAQYFGVPQRRRRIFLVGYLGDWRRAAAVLFERQSMSGDSAPGRAPGQSVAPTIASRPTGGGGLGTDFDLDGGLISHSLMAKGNSSHDPTMETFVTHTLTERHDSSPDGSGRGTPIIPIQGASGGEKAQNGIGIGDQDDPMFTITGRDQHAIYDMRGNGEGNVSPTLRSHTGVNDFAPMIFEKRFARNGRGAPSDVAPPLKADAGRTGKGDAAPIIFSSKQHGQDASEISPALRAGSHDKSHANGGAPPAVAIGWSEELSASCELAGTIQRGGQGGRHEGVMTPMAQVRRLTPRECERLQGFPDDYTLVPYRGRAAADGPRYKAIGNSMAIPVMRWIGKRIAMVEALK
jgi:DNA (cytosine-5)-methyltransferase 1